MGLIIRSSSRKELSPWVSYAALDPDCIDALLLPVREEADAIGAGHNGIKIFHQLSKRQILVYVLPHWEGRLKVKCDPGDDAEGT